MAAAPGVVKDTGGAAAEATAVATDAQGAAELAASDGSATMSAHEHGHLLEQLAKIYRPEDVALAVQHLSDLWSVRQVEAGLHWVHDTYQLPWWATIITCTLALRFLLAPVNISLLRNSLRMKIIMPEVERLNHLMTTAPTHAERVESAQALRTLYTTSKCHPLKNMLTFPILLPPTILSIFGAIHNISLR